MKKNMGKTDRLVRIGLALVFVLLNLMDIVTGTFGAVLMILAAVLVLTSLINFCPLYVPLGINTCEKSAEP